MTSAFGVDDGEPVEKVLRLLVPKSRAAKAYQLKVMTAASNQYAADVRTHRAMMARRAARPTIAVSKREKRKDASGSAIAGAGAVTATTGLVAGGIPGFRSDSDTIKNLRRGSWKQRTGAALSSGRGGVLGYRIDAHQGAMGRFKNDEKYFADKPASRTEMFARGRNAGKIKPEEDIIRHLKIGRAGSRVALVGGAAATAAGVKRVQDKKKVSKSNNDTQRYHGALVGAGGTTAVLSGGGARILRSQGRKWSKREAESLKQAAKIVPNLKPSVSDSEAWKNPKTFAGKSKVQAEAAGRLRGDATQARYFSNVYGKTAKAARKTRNLALATAAVGAGGLMLDRKKEKKVTPKPIAKRYTNEVAQRVHDRTLACPDDQSAALYVAMVVSEGVQHDLSVHADLLQDQVDRVVAKRLADVKKSLVRSTLSKRLEGQDTSSSLAAAQVIAKAGFFDSVSEHQRREWARNQQRDASGQFRTMKQKINYSHSEPLRGRQAAKVGIPAPRVKLNATERARYQQAYQDIERMLRYAPATGEGSVLSVHPVHGNGALGSPKDYLINRGSNGKPTIPSELGTIFTNGGIIDTAELHTPVDLSVGGAAFDLVGALGGGSFAASRAAASTVKDPHTKEYTGVKDLRSFADDWDKAGAQREGSSQLFNRLSAGSKLLQAVAGDRVPARVKLALEAGDYVGQHGEEAVKVIGPHADRAAYRYRGVEKKPDPRLQDSIQNFRTKFSDDESARNALIYGLNTEHARRIGQKVTTDHTDSPLVGYFTSRLPSVDLNSLQLKSGVVPPSQGIIIDRKGKVITEAVGYGDDWYLPFNLKTLSQLKGGEYIRTRTWGGPTTEDIYTGLVSGARAVTVISHNGVYTIEFDDTFRGSRRYNDKAARMVKRYGHLLDAVKSRDVTLASLPDSRRKELEELAEKRAPRDLYPEENKKVITRLELEEAKNPTMSAQDRREAAMRAIDLKLDQVETKDGTRPTWESLAAQHVERKLAQTYAQHQAFTPDLPFPFDEDELRRSFAAEVANPGMLAEQRGWGPDINAALERAQSDYQAKMNPLSLNGQGYEKALHALHEQFPYYIRQPVWQPKRLGGKDTGYVKPQFNRPAEALVGYYDKSIGTDKVGADTVRHQNRLHTQSTERAAAAANTSSADSPERRTVPESAAQSSSELRSMREAESVRAMHAALYAPKFWHPENGAAPSEPVTQAHLDQVRAAYALEAAAMAPADFMKWFATEPEKARSALKRDDDLLEEKKIIRVPPQTRRSFASLGRPAQTQRPSLALLVADPDADFDFGPSLEPDRPPEAYRVEGERALTNLGLTGVGFDSAGLQDALDAKHTELRRLVDHPRADASTIKLSLENLARAKQAKRRQVEAERASAPVTLLSSEVAAAQPPEAGSLGALLGGLPENTQVIAFETGKSDPNPRVQGGWA